MSRMYSHAKGQAASKRPEQNKVPAWITYKANEIEALVAKLAKEKLTTSQIGLRLRDSYGIPSVKTITGKRVDEILHEKKLNKSIPQDLIDCIAKAIKIQKHIEENGQDRSAERGLTLAKARIGRLAKYYKEVGKIDKDWKFDPEKAGMYLE